MTRFDRKSNIFRDLSGFSPKNLHILSDYDILMKVCVIQHKFSKEVFMSALRIILTILFVMDCLFLTIVVLMQEGKSQGLGAIAGAAESYLGKNKARGMEGTLVTITRVLAVLFILLAIVLNLRVI